MDKEILEILKRLETKIDEHTQILSYDSYTCKEFYPIASIRNTTTINETPLPKVR